MLPRKIFRGAGKIPYLLRHVRCELMSETSASQHEPTGFYRSRRGRIPREKRNRVEVNTRSYKHADTISGLGASLVQCNYLPTVLERKNRLSLPDIAEVGSAWCGCRSLERSMRALCRYFQRLPKYFMPSCPGADNLFDMENALFNSCTGHSGALYPSYFVRQDAGNGGNECAVAAIAVSLLQ